MLRETQVMVLSQEGCAEKGILSYSTDDDSVGVRGKLERGVYDVG